MEDDEQEEAGGKWLLSYADLMTLLFAAFVVLYGITPQGQSDQVMGVASSIREAFVDIPDDIPLEERDGPIKKGIASFNHFRGETMRTPNIKKYKRYTNIVNVIDEDMAQFKKLITLLAERQGVGKADPSEPIKVKKTEDGFALELVGSTFFERGKYRLRKGELKKLSMVGQLLKGMGRQISIEGHTDDLPNNGVLSNWELSALRASHIGRYFMNTVEIDNHKISIAGYADKRPLFSNTSDKNRKLNRRVEIKVHYEAH